jgi:hypothetical protein
VVTPIHGSVIHIDTEMSGAQLDEWLRAQRIQRDDRVIVIPLRGQVAALNLLDQDTRGRDGSPEFATMTARIW